ncbi:MAG: N-acetylglucosamine-6-phosphate deacetylase NagA [Candidatus Saccharicenans subterraneus]|uniref:N-acetylglucosamine-6-phosphate deacetylase NagA n=1 Tax=Candidatus Saccharicenans subterraneus TaxID=2508984 RepID=A0A3E2BKM8_9BACT|nr:MAG: N-acetylglucosamine-6-phosphate deacetylase NagA [Candidatus Saccharicenans subterraneum]
MKPAIIKGNLILPDRVIEKGELVIEGGLIKEVREEGRGRELPSADVHDYSGHWVSPGLVDVHLHGALGHEVMDAEVAGLKKIAGHQAACGVTAFFPTTLTAPLETVIRAVETVRAAAGEELPSEIAGIHLEGPYVSLKRKGAQDPKYVREIQGSDLERLKAALGPLKTLITVAPEAGRNLDFIPRMVDLGWVVSIGHSDATYEEATRAIAAGANHATHLFNAWREFHHREPGGLGAVLDSDRVYAELITDGIHVHPSFIRLAVFRKGPERTCLITDSLKASGLPDGTYDWGDMQIVLKGAEVRLRDSGVLAGSVLHLNQAIRNVYNWTGLPVPAVVRMASLTPAESVGLGRVMGSLEPGKLANLAVFDSGFETVATYLRGKKVYPGS